MSSLLQLCRRVARETEAASPLYARPWALASLARAQGSTYRKPGARLLVAADGSVTGVLSGGCLEQEIARCGLEVMATGHPRLLSYDTRRLFGCDGALEILVEALPALSATPAQEPSNHLLMALGEKLHQRQACWLRTRFEPAANRDEPLGTELLTKTDARPSMPGVLLHAVPLPMRLLLLGSGPEIQPLSQLASCLGWVVETCSQPAQLSPSFVPDARTAAVVMTHHLGRDCTALARLLPLGLPYIGLLGPRKRQTELLARLELEIDVEESWLASLYSPAGLDIGSECPEDIALAIVSEASAVIAGRQGGHLRARQGAIHEKASQPAPTTEPETSGLLKAPACPSALPALAENQPRTAA